MASDLPDLLKRLDASVTHLTHVFVPLVTSLVDDPTILASPEGAKLMRQRFTADTVQIKAIVECLPDVQSRLETERREVEELNQSVAAERI